MGPRRFSLKNQESSRGSTASGVLDRDTYSEQPEHLTLCQTTFPPTLRTPIHCPTSGPPSWRSACKSLKRMSSSCKQSYVTCSIRTNCYACGNTHSNNSNALAPLTPESAGPALTQPSLRPVDGPFREGFIIFSAHVMQHRHIQLQFRYQLLQRRIFLLHLRQATYYAFQR